MLVLVFPFRADAVVKIHQGSHVPCLIVFVLVDNISSRLAAVDV